MLLPFALGGLTLGYSLLGWLALLYLGIIPTPLAQLLYFGGICHTTVTVASTATLLEPLVSTVLARQLLNEQLGSFGNSWGDIAVGGDRTAVLGEGRDEVSERLSTYRGDESGVKAGRKNSKKWHQYKTELSKRRISILKHLFCRFSCERIRKKTLKVEKRKL